MKLDKLTEVITYSLLLAAKAHAWHFLTRGPGSYAKHQAFGQLYQLMHKIADDLAEPAMGSGIDLGGLVTSSRLPPAASLFRGPDLAATELDDHLARLEDLNRTAAAMTGMDWLANIAQGAQAEIKKIQFLLELR
jgi:hypothetical protein